MKTRYARMMSLCAALLLAPGAIGGQPSTPRPHSPPQPGSVTADLVRALVDADRHYLDRAARLEQVRQSLGERERSRVDALEDENERAYAGQLAVLRDRYGRDTVELTRAVLRQIQQTQPQPPAGPEQPPPAPAPRPRPPRETPPERERNADRERDEERRRPPPSDGPRPSPDRPADEPKPQDPGKGKPDDKKPDKPAKSDPDEGRAENEREVQKLHDEYARELATLEEERDRELAEAEREGKHEKAREKMRKYEEKLAGLRRKYEDKLRKRERWAEERSGRLGEGELVTICFAPPGEPAARRTRRVSRDALPHYLDMGATLGPCDVVPVPAGSAPDTAPATPTTIQLPPIRIPRTTEEAVQEILRRMPESPPIIGPSQYFRRSRASGGTGDAERALQLLESELRARAPR
ncbi:MAG TPA: hypothetical protein VD963_07950 [Phycisphaerales bacterium]|nr:hypothetical protein [Phycisphaerales bacterium]